MQIRVTLFLAVIMAMLVADLRPGGFGWMPSAAWADDDDDDATPRRRQVQPRLPAISLPRLRTPPAPRAQVAPLPRRAPNEVIARSLSGEDLQTLQAAGFTVLRRVRLASGDEFFRLRKPAAMTMLAARDMVRGLASTGSADFNHYYRTENAGAAAAIPGCTKGSCLARQMIAWPAVTGGCGMPPRIGMVDTGLNADHDALRGARIRVHRIQPGDQLPPSDKLHGTAVAALLVGQSDTRAPGLVPHAELVAVDAFHKVGGDERMDAFALVEALDYLTVQQVGIVNLSISGPPNQTLRQQLRRMERGGIVLVAAAGNGGPAAKPAYPAAYRPVIAVTAVDRRAQVYRRANRGRHIDLAAPGVDVWTAASISGRRNKTGTSYAAPFVTAAAALLLQAEPGLSVAEIRSRMENSAEDLGMAGPDEVFGHGLIQPPDPCRKTGVTQH